MKVLKRNAMRKILILIPILLFTASVFSQQSINQTDAQGRKQGEWIKKDPTGKLIYKARFADDLPVGKMTRYHSTGGKKAELFFSATSDSASAKMYNTKGKLAAKGKYFKQKKVGEWLYYKNNRVASSENYTDNKKHGIAKRYYESGELLEESIWENGIQQGLYKAFTKHGKKYLECMFKNGKRNGWCVVFFPNGEMEMEAFYKDNLRHGTWRFFDDQGNHRYSLEYENAFLTNPAVLDSINSIELNMTDKNREQLIDPEKFMQDPGQYMMKNSILRR